MLAVIHSIKVVGQEDGLVGVRGAWIYLNPGEEDDAVFAGEVLGLQLLNDIYVCGPVIIAEVVPLRRSDLSPLGPEYVILMVGRILRGDEIQLEVAALGMGSAEGTAQPEGDGKERNDDSAGRNR